MMYETLYHAPMPSWSVCQRQNFWMMTYCFSRKRIYYHTKTYIQCFHLDDSSHLSFHLSVGFHLTKPLFYLFILCSLFQGPEACRTHSQILCQMASCEDCWDEACHKEKQGFFFPLKWQSHLRIWIPAVQYLFSDSSPGYVVILVILQLVQT